MKNIQIIIIIVLAILAIVFGIVWMNAANENKALQQSNEDLKTLYESTTQTIDEITASLEAIDEDLSGQLFTESEIPDMAPAERQQRLIGTIANLRDQIEADKKKISQLEAQLASSRTQLRSVQETVNRLKASIAEKETIMAELQDRLGIVNETLEEERRLSQMEIAEREQTIMQKEAELTAAEREANNIYYVYGSRKNLMEQGIIDRKGGILGIGRVTTVAKDLEVDKFNQINLVDTLEIRFPATRKGYSILSNHVATTYSVERDGDEYVLTVLDPENFRKQKFLVIELL
nr:hypothetical protein [Candidatus Cloacimonadota bacterium]